MVTNDSSIRLYGRILLDGQIRAQTGLHIGAGSTALAIGAVSLPVIRNVVDQLPYIPGSSLKGKMRSLWEKIKGVEQNSNIGQGVKIHVCKTKQNYDECPVCQIYGSLGQSEASFPTRIIVRDVPLNAESLANARTDLPYTEVKWEAAIDRVTSAATPRQIERVPAGAVFDNMQIVFNVFHAEDRQRFLDVLTALQLVEDDYLGGQGSRGSGRVKFENLRLTCKNATDYNKKDPPQRELPTLTAPDDLLDWITRSLPVEG